ncbi:hypothetical protein GLYMA_01G002250v4 [Glycine max]|nr:hypothetical protein GLYMA_01G002250v4 [Glycine max]KAH1160916.1 hypothetical protein GYH30_000026 [Glycine max]
MERRGELQQQHLLTFLSPKQAFLCVPPPPVRFGFYIYISTISKYPLAPFFFICFKGIIFLLFRCICLCHLIRNSRPTTSSAVVFHKLLAKLPFFVFSCSVCFNQSLFLLLLWVKGDVSMTSSYLF